MSDDLGPSAVYGWLSLPGPNPCLQKELAGAAFLLSSDLAVTCAHAIRDHLGLQKTPAVAPNSLVALRFEALDTEIAATVLPEGWYPDIPGGSAGQLRDVAFLRLNAPLDIAGLRYLALAPWVPRGGRPARVIGAEPGYQNISQNVPVRLAENTNTRGLWQLDAIFSAGFAVVRGFSGAPLLDEAGTVLWGMVVEMDAKGRPVAFAVGADRLYGASGMSFRLMRYAGFRSNCQKAKTERDALRKRLGDIGSSASRRSPRPACWDASGIETRGGRTLACRRSGL